MKPHNNTSGMFRPRYSHFDSGLFQELPESSDKTDLPPGYYSGSSTGSGSFDWGSLISGILNVGNSFITSFFNKGDKYAAEAYRQMYNEQQKTTTILWVVIGLILALGVVLIIRKTK